MINKYLYVWFAIQSYAWYWSLLRIQSNIFCLNLSMRTYIWFTIPTYTWHLFLSRICNSIARLIRIPFRIEKRIFYLNLSMLTYVWFNIPTNTWYLFLLKIQSCIFCLNVTYKSSSKIYLNYVCECVRFVDLYVFTFLHSGF